jgi:outer membrane protein TolC
VLLAQRLLEVQESALELAKANLDDVTARKEAGIAIEYDRLRARVEVSNVEADMIQQRNVLNRSWTALFRAMGVSQKSEVKLTDELTYMPIAPDFQRAVEIAFENRPELYRGELEVRVQEKVLRTYYSDYLPEVEGWFNQRWANPDPKGGTGWGDEWTAGVRMSWALFDGLLREGNIIQQKALLEQSSIRLADTEQMVLEEVKNAVLDLADAEELVKSQELNLETAREALRLVEIGAKEGVNTALEVLDARSALTRSVGLYYNSLYAHTVARLTLQRAIGMLGPPPGTDSVPQENLPKPSVVPQFMPAAAEGGEAAGAEGEPEPALAPPSLPEEPEQAPQE